MSDPKQNPFLPKRSRGFDGRSRLYRVRQEVIDAILDWWRPTAAPDWVTKFYQKDGFVWFRGHRYALKKALQT